jgi:hypothetical protein
MMLGLSSLDERIVAVLHDVCEDCPGWTLDRLRAEGFSEHIITALDAVTKRDGEDYDDFARCAAANPIGRNVKLVDLADNCDLSRIAEPTGVDHQRIEKYQWQSDSFAPCKPWGISELASINSIPLPLRLPTF